MLLDECAALGRIPILAESISYLPGLQRGAVALVPSIRPAQLRGRFYGGECLRKDDAQEPGGPGLSLLPRIILIAKEILGWSLVMTTVAGQIRPRSPSPSMLDGPISKGSRRCQYQRAATRAPCLAAKKCRASVTMMPSFFTRACGPSAAQEDFGIFFGTRRFSARDSCPTPDRQGTALQRTGSTRVQPTKPEKCGLQGPVAAGPPVLARPQRNLQAEEPRRANARRPRV